MAAHCGSRAGNFNSHGEALVQNFTLSEKQSGLFEAPARSNADQLE